MPEWEEVITVPLHCSGGVSALDMVDVLVENKGGVNTKDFSLKSLKSIKRSYINYLMFFNKFSKAGTKYLG